MTLHFLILTRACQLLHVVMIKQLRSGQEVSRLHVSKVVAY